MSKQKTKDGQVIHLDIRRHCSHKSGEKRDLIFECHLHKAVWTQRLKLATQLISGKPIHLMLEGAVDMRIGDRVVSEIEL